MQPISGKKRTRIKRIERIATDGTIGYAILKYRITDVTKSVQSV